MFTDNLQITKSSCFFCPNGNKQILLKGTVLVIKFEFMFQKIMSYFPNITIRLLQRHQCLLFRTFQP